MVTRAQKTHTNPNALQRANNEEQRENDEVNSRVPEINEVATNITPEIQRAMQPLILQFQESQAMLLETMRKQQEFFEKILKAKGVQEPGESQSIEVEVETPLLDPLNSQEKRPSQQPHYTRQPVTGNKTSSPQFTSHDQTHNHKNMQNTPIIISPNTAVNQSPIQDPLHTPTAPFITRQELQKMLRQEREIVSASDIDLRPPYPTHIALKCYPIDYKPPAFVMFNGRKGNAKEHII